MGVLVLLRARKSYLSGPYFLTSLAAFCYCFMIFGFIYFPEQTDILTLWTKIFLSGALFIVPALLNLLLCVTREKNGLLKVIFYFSCGLGIVALFFWGGFLELKLIFFSWGSSISLTSIPYILFLVNAGLFLPLGVIIPLINKNPGNLSGFAKKQKSFISFCAAFCGLALVLSFLPWAGSVIFQIGTLLLAGAVIFIAYSIVNYRFLATDIIIHKIVKSVLSVLPVLGVHILIICVVLKNANRFFSASFSLIVIMGIVMFSPYKRIIKTVSDKIVFRGKYDYQKILLDLSRNIVAILDLDQLLNYITQVIVQTFALDKVAVLLESEDEHVFIVRAVQGVAPEDEQEVVLPSDDALIKRIKGSRSALVKQECKQLEASAEVEAQFEKLAALKAEVIVPLFFKERFVGFITLNAKENGAIYNQGDIEALEAFAQEAAAAIENARLYSEAIVDNITKAFNYNYFHMRLGEEIARCKRYGHPISLLMVDINRFKEFDGEYGHQIGDLILKNISLLLKNALRSVDILARYGGGQFAVILPETGKSMVLGPVEVIRNHIDDTMLVAERLRKNVDDLKIGHAGKILGVTVSIGVAYFDGVDKRFSTEEFMQNANEALSQAKESGRNKVVLYGGKKE
ncbi:MAG: sensor domain-containing diguanylate cyclase [Candidatus Omnitrophota bacterium]